jgi:hypothetical protein
MRLPHAGRFALACLALALAAAARAETPPDPFRLVPAEANLVVEVRRPRQALETVLNLPALQDWLQLAPAREFLDSTNVHLFRQFLAYFERETGSKWPELLDQVAGGGAVLAVKTGPDPAPALLVLQGTDAAAVEKFAHLAVTTLEQELARQGAPGRPEKGSYRGIEFFHVGKGFCGAVLGKTIVIGSIEAALQRALDLHLDGPGKSLASNPGIAGARALLPGQPAAMAWLNMETVRKGPQAKGVYMLPRDNAILTVALGGLLDVLGRAPFVCAGVYLEPDGLAVRFRVPCGRDGSAPALLTHIPPADQAGCRPLLKPRGALYSQSYYLDVGKFWDNRDKLFTKQQVKNFEDFDRRSKNFLSGSHFGQLLTWAGPYQRIVIAQQAKPTYGITPKTQLPAFAFVVEMRQPKEFTQAVEKALHSAGLLGGLQFGLKQIDQKHGDYKLTGFRFDEKRKVPQDVNDIRFNFSPCYGAVGKQFFAASTLELGHELIDLLDREMKDGADWGYVESDRTQVYSQGGADFLKSIEDILLTQAILDQALSPEDARKQVRTFIDLVRRLGVLERDIGYGKSDFHYDIRLILGK